MACRWKAGEARTTAQLYSSLRFTRNCCARIPRSALCRIYAQATGWVYDRYAYSQVRQPGKRSRRGNSGTHLLKLLRVRRQLFLQVFHDVGGRDVVRSCVRLKSINIEDARGVGVAPPKEFTEHCLAFRLILYPIPVLLLLLLLY